MRRISPIDKYWFHDNNNPIKYDWTDFSNDFEKVNDIKPFTTRVGIPSGPSCVRVNDNGVVKCRYYNDFNNKKRCELLDISEDDQPCLKKAFKICVDYNPVIKPKGFNDEHTN